ncbi:glutamyl-tRNA reductase [Methylobacterium sp. DM1]|nr:glutamyl-tRNA reductase [Methylobacterium sp. DM1]
MMTFFVSMAADVLVAVLLVATIVSSVRLSRRINRLKADEAALRSTIGDLVVASATAERAIAGLRATLDECDRTLTERLAGAERTSTDLAAHVQAGESVIARIAAIVGQARHAATAPAAAPSTSAPQAGPRAVLVDAPAGGNGERVGAALAAAQALSERALDRLRARAA